MIVAKTRNSIVLESKIPPDFTIEEAERAAEYAQRYTEGDGIPVHDGCKFLMEIISE